MISLPMLPSAAAYMFSKENSVAYACLGRKMAPAAARVRGEGRNSKAAMLERLDISKYDGAGEEEDLVCGT